MTWNQLLSRGVLDRQSPSKQELDDLRGVVDRNLSDAALAGISPDGRFEHAYNAARALATMAIRCTGHRVKGTGAHHTSFEALKLAMGSTIDSTANYLDRCRRLRNQSLYDVAAQIGQAEADNLLAEAQRLRSEVETWVTANYTPLK